ncbi:MAG: TIGR03808 family TAT-translocated repetitive protein, partial [Nitratireductor sp.]
MLNRRAFLAGLAGAGGLAAGAAQGAALSGIETASIRGTLDASELGVQPGLYDDQSEAFARVLDKA